MVLAQLPGHGLSGRDEHLIGDAPRPRGVDSQADSRNPRGRRATDTGTEVPDFTSYVVDSFTNDRYISTCFWGRLALSIAMILAGTISYGIPDPS